MRVRECKEIERYNSDPPAVLAFEFIFDPEKLGSERF